MTGIKISKLWSKLWMGLAKVPKIYYLVLFVVIVKQVVWITVVPIWQTPDEPSHFAQIQWYAEQKSLAIHPLENLSQELAVSENLLGVRRDKFGNNQFTYHPEYKIPYSTSQTGLNEKKIVGSTTKDRTLYVGKEAAMYPPLHYVLTLPFYEVVSRGSIIDRLYALRLSSLVILLLTTIVCFFIGSELFSTTGAIALTVMVAFQPMISFLAAGYHPDNLLNLLSALIVLLAVLVIKRGFKWSYLLLTLLVLFLGWQTKQFIIFLTPGIFALLFFYYFKKRPITSLLGSALILCSLALSFILLLPLPFMPTVNSHSPLFSLTLVDYLHFRLQRLLFEMWPWYWGVFKWLGVTLNPLVMKVVTRVAALSVIGLIIGISIRLWKKRFGPLEKVIIFFLIWTGSYLLYMFLWDYRLMQSNGFSLGLQGRYLFPLIICHMTIFLYGLTNLFSIKIRNFICAFIIIAFIFLNISALWTVAASYYDMNSRSQFINELSQYKPQIIKTFLRSLI